MRAEQLLVALALLAPTGAAADLGTLFHTPQERSRLDRMRRGEPADPTPPAAALPARTPEVTGFVRRSDGRNTVWIDGRALATSDPKNAPLFDPRAVRDMAPDLPPSAVKVVPAPPKKPGPGP